MVTFISHNVAETVELGRSWAKEAGPGWLIGLTGELGAGKTQLVKGLALGLGVVERVHSPSFTLVNEYTGGRCALFHLDFYRLETPRQIESAGLDEYLFQPRGVTAVEWFERWWDAGHEAGRWRAGGGPRLRRVWIELLSPEERRIAY